MLAPAVLTLAEATAVKAAGLEAIRAGAREIDLSALAEADSSAIAVLLAWRRAALPDRLALPGASANLRSLAALYGVDDLIFGAAPPAEA